MWSSAASPSGPGLQDEPGRPGPAPRVAAEPPQPEGLRVEIGHRDHAIMDEPGRPRFRKTPLAADFSGRPGGLRGPRVRKRV